MRGRGARTGVVGFAAVVELVATVDVDVVRGGEAVELAPAHPASAIAIATPNAAAPRTVDVDREDVVVVGGDIALQRKRLLARCEANPSTSARNTSSSSRHAVA